jgi:hypothetical protein
MSFQELEKWAAWLPLTEWWYNTSFHTSLKFTPFEALYGYPPPEILEIMVLGPESTATEFLQQKHQMISKLKDNLAQSHARIKKLLTRIDQRGNSKWVTWSVSNCSLTDTLL